MHGACRMAGNAATQAAASGLMAARGMVEYTPPPPAETQEILPFRENQGIRATLLPRIRETVSRHIERERNAEGLLTALTFLRSIREQASGDTFTEQCALSALLLGTVALAREESRGTHCRTDFPEQRREFDCSIRIKNEDGGIVAEKIKR